MNVCQCNQPALPNCLPELFHLFFNTKIHALHACLARWVKQTSANKEKQNANKKKKKLSK
jgi:hypothetical protein